MTSFIQAMHVREQASRPVECSQAAHMITISAATEHSHRMERFIVPCRRCHHLVRIPV